MRIIISLMLFLAGSYGSALSAQNNTSNTELSYTFHFASNKSILDDHIITTLVKKTEELKDHQIIIQGHTDNIGSEAYNKLLAQKRAHQIKKKLILAGLSDNRITTKSWGEELPIASNSSSKGQALNRRVEILLTTDKDEKIDYQTLLDKKLNALARKASKTYSLVSNQEYTLTAPKGTRLKIPADAFDLPLGSAVQLTVTEIFSKSDMILHGLTTSSNEQQLISGGMVKIDAHIANGKTVKLKKGKAIKVNVPSQKPISQMQLFDSETIGNTVNWVNPQRLAQEALPYNQSFADFNDQNCLNCTLPNDCENLGYQYIFNPLTAIYSQPTKAPYQEKVAQTEDSTYLNTLNKKLSSLQKEPYKGFDPYKKKRFLFWNIRVKKNSADSSAYLAEQNKKIKNLEADIQKQVDFLQNYQQMLIDNGLTTAQQKKIYDAWILSNKQIALQNLDLAIKYKDIRAIKSYINNASISKKDSIIKQLLQKESIKAQTFLSLPNEVQDSILFSVYKMTRDSSTMNLMQTYHYKTLMGMAISGIPNPKANYENLQNYCREQNEKSARANLEHGIKTKNINSITRFIYLLSPEKKDSLWMDLFLTNSTKEVNFILKQDRNYQDSIFYTRYRPINPSLAKNLMRTRKYRTMINMCINGEKNPEAAYEELIKQEEYQYWLSQANILGVETIEEAKKIVANREKINSYSFSVKSLGRTINCDYFPRMAPNSQLVQSSVQLEVPFSRTKTFMVFHKYNTVMPAYLANTDHSTQPNTCSFVNVPQNASVSIVSFYLDTEGEIQLAIKNAYVKKKIPALDYQQSTEKEFKRKLNRLNRSFI